MTRTIAAAGGLVWRPGPGRAGVEVCLVHRPRYDDWSLPKGGVKRGEHPLAAAVREVAEETGVRAVPRLPLPPTRYRVGGVPKVVDYWAMAAAGPADGSDGADGSAEPPPEPGSVSEVDQVAWLPVARAAERVRYPHDAALLRHFAAVPPVTAVVLLVRHADAGTSWRVADHTRPLSGRGRADADALCHLLALCAPTRVVSATPARCRQTVAPLAAARRLPVAVDPAFDEETGDPPAAAARLRQLAGTGATTVVCSQGAVIPPLLAALAGAAPVAAVAGPGGAAPEPGWGTRKGDGWLLSFTAEEAAGGGRGRPEETAEEAADGGRSRPEQTVPHLLDAAPLRLAHRPGLRPRGAPTAPAG